MRRALSLMLTPRDKCANNVLKEVQVAVMMYDTHKILATYD